MKLEHLMYLLVAYLYLHYLLAKPNLNPALRNLLEPAEIKTLTQLFAALATA